MVKKKKKGSRYTAPKPPKCEGRTAIYRGVDPKDPNRGKNMPHLYTSKKRTKIDGEWTEWEVRCSGCGKKDPSTRYPAVTV